MSEVLSRVYKKAMMNMLKDLMNKMDNNCKNMWNFKRGMETI